MKPTGTVRRPVVVVLALSLAVLAAACSPSGKIPADMRSETAAGLSFAVPQDWVSSPPSTNMRAAQFTLPAAAGGDAPQLVLSFFGEGKGGDVASNIDRWIGMIGTPDGKPAANKAKRETRKIGPLTVSMVTADGSYDAFVGMGMNGGMGGGMSGGMGGAHGGGAKPDYRLWGAVVEGPGGPWFFKATGPRAALEKAEPALKALVASVKKGA
jgi:hypothetical protein